MQEVTHTPVVLLALAKSGPENIFSIDEDLISFLKKNLITELHILADVKSYFPDDIEQLSKIKLTLADHGITVHRVITPADYAWHIKYKDLAFFDEACAGKNNNTILAILNNPKFAAVKALMGDSTHYNATPGTAFIEVGKNSGLRPKACRSTWTLNKICSLSNAKYNSPRDCLIDRFIAHNQDSVSNLILIQANHSPLAITPILENGTRVNSENSVNSNLQDRSGKCVIC
jgi:hypothetical protein